MTIPMHVCNVTPIDYHLDFKFNKILFFITKPIALLTLLIIGCEKLTYSTTTSFLAQQTLVKLVVDQEMLS